MITCNGCVGSAKRGMTRFLFRSKQAFGAFRKADQQCLKGRSLTVRQSFQQDFVDAGSSIDDDSIGSLTLA